MAEPQQADALRGARWPVTEALDGRADRRRARCEAVWPLSVEAGWNQNRRRLALHAGRRPRLRLSGPDGKWQRKLAGRCRSAEARLDQHGAGDPASARRSGLGTGPAEALHRRGRGRPARSPASMPRSRDGRSTCRWASAISTRSRAGTSIEVKDAAVRPPAGINLRPDRPADLPRLALYDRPLTGMERPAILAHLALRQPGRAWIAEDAAGKIVRLRAGPRGQGGDLARSRRGRQRGDRAGADRQGGRVGARTLHHRRAGGSSRRSLPGWRRRARPRRAATCA